jgi:hypothetical protein
MFESMDTGRSAPYSKLVGYSANRVPVEDQYSISVDVALASNGVPVDVQAVNGLVGHDILRGRSRSNITDSACSQHQSITR